MESPLKKKKVNHPPCVEDSPFYNDHQHELTTLILSDHLEETPQLGLLQHQLGGNKIKKIHASLTWIKEVNIGFSFDIVPYEGGGDLVYLTKQYQGAPIYVFDLERNEIINTFTKPPTVNVQVDRKREFFYGLADGKLMKGCAKDFQTIFWRRRVEIEETFMFYYCETKNEIYLYEDETINGTLEIQVLDCENGSLKRKVRIFFDRHFPTSKTLLEHDGKDRFYIVLKSFAYPSSDDDDDEDPATIDKCYLIMHDESSNETVVVDVYNEDDEEHDEIGVIVPNDKFITLIAFSGIMRVYDNTTLEFLGSFSSDISFLAEFFDIKNNRLFIQEGNTLKIEQFELITSIVDLPLQREVFHSLEKLGCKLPTIIPKESYETYEIPDCIQYLRRMDFDNMILWYIDEEISKCFIFQECLDLDVKMRKWANENDALIIGGCQKSFQMKSDGPKVGFCVYVKICEVSNNSDFPIYIHYNGVLTKKFTISELIAKLRPAEYVVHSILSEEYIIDFPYIYSNLLRKGIISSETRQIDQSLLFEVYQKAVCGFKKNCQRIGEQYGLSTIRLDNFDYKKVDLLLMAEYCDSPHAFTFIE